MGGGGKHGNRGAGGKGLLLPQANRAESEWAVYPGYAIADVSPTHLLLPYSFAAQQIVPVSVPDVAVRTELSD